jgi:hypothetical protein
VQVTLPWLLVGSTDSRVAVTLRKRGFESRPATQHFRDSDGSAKKLLVLCVLSRDPGSGLAEVLGEKVQRIPWDHGAGFLAV